MRKKICVYCSSSNAVDTKYFKLANELGSLISQNNFDLVYGGTTVGLMYEIANTAKLGGSKIISVIPKTIKDMGIANDTSDELIVTQTMHERKQIMEDIADAFIAMPGGFGTLEELIEAITLKHLGFHNKAIIILNAFRFYDLILDFFEKFYSENFAKTIFKESYIICKTPQEAILSIKNYKYSNYISKVF